MSKYLEAARVKFGIGQQTGRSSEWIFTCPMCGKKKLYVNVQTGKYLCFRCYPLVRGCLRSELSLFTPMFEGSRESGSDPKKPSIQVDWHPLSKNPRSLLESIVLDYYIKERGLSWRLISMFGLGYSRFFLAASIPLYAHFYALRFLYDAISKYLYTPGFMKSKQLFNYERALSSGARRIFVFEGVFDVICARPFDSVAVLGSYLSSDQIELLSRLDCDELVVCLDPDVEFERQVESLFVLQERFSGVVLRGILPEEVDPGDLGSQFNTRVRIVDWDEF